MNEIGFWYQPGWIMTEVEEGDGLPTKYWLGQNQPNPFNPVTTIRFALPDPGRVTMKLYDVEPVSLDDIYAVEADIFAPCSLGGPLNEETIPKLGCDVIVGAANNQLATDEDADRIDERDILYAPDFVANAGGLINVSEEIRGYTEDRAAVHIDKVYDNTLRVLEAAGERRISPHFAAVQMAEERIRDIGNLRLFRRSGDDRN